MCLFIILNKSNIINIINNINKFLFQIYIKICQLILKYFLIYYIKQIYILGSPAAIGYIIETYNLEMRI